MGCSSDTREIPDYAELHCLSNFSFLRGASHPEELVERADALGYRALALTDEVSLAGIVRAHGAARGRSLRLIVGSELHLRNDIALVALATNRHGYARLSRLITRSRRQAPRGEYRVDDPGDALDDCLVLWSPGRDRDPEQLAYLRSRFAGRLWTAVALTGQADDREHLERLATLSRRTGVPMVATGSVLMHTRARRFLQDTLTAIRTHRTLAEAGHAPQPNGERHLRPRSVLARRYPRELLIETLAIAERCSFSLDELRYEYPDDVVPEGHSPVSWLRRLTEEGLKGRWPAGTPLAVRRLIDRELALIKELGYAHYFLTVHDIVSFARSRDIYCQGRGSAANSAVCYALGITEVDPSRMQLLIERFLTSSPP